MGLDTVELIMEIERTFDINIANAEAEKLDTVGDIYKCVLMHLRSNDRKGFLSDEEVKGIVRYIMADKAGNSLYEVTLQKSITNDLGLD